MRTEMWGVGALVVPLALALHAAPDDVGAEVVTVFHDPEVVESSGLVVTDEVAVTVNDSGDSARIFTIDLATGDTVGVTSWDAEARDIEALAPAGSDAVWVGDIGDNMESRDAITVTRVPFGRGDRAVPGESFELTWADGARDAEALLASPDGRLHVVTKDTFGGQVYAAPRRLDPSGPNVLEPVGEAAGLITDGAFFPDGRHVILRNYGVAYVLETASWREVGSFRLPPQQQGEGIAVSAAGEVYLSSEGADSELLRITLPADVAAAMAAGDEPTAEPSPASPEPPVQAPVDAADEPVDWWPWAIGGLAGLLAVLVLVRSLRPR